MIDHLGFSVSDYERAKAFYAKALAPLGYGLIMEVTAEQTGHAAAAGFGADGKPDFWFGGEGALNKPVHIAIAAKDRATVDAFYKAAIAAGGRDNGTARHPAALPSELLRRLRARSRRPQHRGRLPHSGIRQAGAMRCGTSARHHRCCPLDNYPDDADADRTTRDSAVDSRHANGASARNPARWSAA